MAGNQLVHHQQPHGQDVSYRTLQMTPDHAGLQFDRLDITYPDTRLSGK